MCFMFLVLQLQMNVDVIANFVIIAFCMLHFFALFTFWFIPKNFSPGFLLFKIIIGKQLFNFRKISCFNLFVCDFECLMVNKISLPV